MSRFFGTFSLCLLFLLLWCSGWVGSKYMLTYASPLSALTWRYVAVVGCLLVLVSVFGQWRRLSRHEILHHSSIGLLSHTAFLSLSVASMEAGVSAGMVAFITALQPMLTAVIASPLTRERVSTRQWTGIILGASAAMYVVSDRIALGGSVIAFSLPFMSVFAVTLATVLCRRNELRMSSKRQAPTPLLLTLLIHSVAALIGFILLAWQFGSFEADWSIRFVSSIAYMAIVVSIASFGLMFLLLRRISAVKLSSIVYLTPPTTMLMGWFMFGETLSGTDLTGLAIAAFAVWLISTGKRHTSRRKRGPSPVIRSRPMKPLDIEL